MNALDLDRGNTAALHADDRDLLAHTVPARGGRHDCQSESLPGKGQQEQDGHRGEDQGVDRPVELF